MIEVIGLSGGYGKKQVLHNLSFTIREGEFLGIIGPNGSGKSTLLRFLAGIISPYEGEVLLHQKTIKKYSRKEIAQIMAVLPQEQIQPFAFTVREIVAMGRHPHQRGILPLFSDYDHAIIEEVIDFLHLKDIMHMPFHLLSGGQKQRAILAQVLAQEPTIILLDEPTNHLDVFFQVELLDQLKRWMTYRKITVVSVLHDLNLTSLYSDRVLALDKAGTMVALGDVNEVLTTKLIQDIYGLTMIQISHPHNQKPQFFLQPTQ